MLLITLLILALVGWGIAEYHRHQTNINRIPVRIHINGSRGKSSVTRLVGGALRESEKTVFTKTTGTSARMIYPDGEEHPVIRAGKPNIIEQLSIVRHALEFNPDIFVTECMAVQPVLQKVVEDKMIRSTIGAVTNVRPDHLDEMGPAIEDVELALAGTIPHHGVFFTAEQKHYNQMEEIAVKRNTEFIKVSGDIISDEDMEGFGHIEHKDNVALALAIAEKLGVARDKALAGMKKAKPDPGALRIYDLEFFGKSIKFVNAFAANDIESYRIIWRMLNIKRSENQRIIVLVNSRKDRIQRAEQLSDFIAGDVEADYFVIAGEYTRTLSQKALNRGLDPGKLVEVGDIPVENIFEKTISLIPEKGIVIGIGNIVGFGENIAMVFINRGKESVSRSVSN
ncbi:MAG: poly-gamma-glutamate synthase PgsB [candidate division Zixibacteria bacterium]|nr:poly-gamma-glutamate synthase PgsB [candidate division Zixibacteria bacterium]